MEDKWLNCYFNTYCNHVFYSYESNNDIKSNRIV